MPFNSHPISDSSIAILTFNLAESYAEIDIHSEMAHMLAKEMPDLVIMGGDQISDYVGGAPRPKPKDWTLKYWKLSLDPLLHYNGRIPWATIMGNHDYGIQMTSDEILTFDSTFNGSLTQASDDTGYVVDILEHTGNEVAARVWLFQSGTSGMRHRHVEWYSTKSAELNKGTSASLEDPEATTSTDKLPAPALAFVHIPLKELMDIYNEGVFRGSMTDRDGICCQSAEPNLDFYDTIVRMGDIKVVSSGHDHGNDMMGELGGINIGYGLKSGKGGYEVPVRGARIFVLSSTAPDDPILKTIPGAILFQRGNKTSFTRSKALSDSLKNMSSTDADETGNAETTEGNIDTRVKDEKEVLVTGPKAFVIHSYNSIAHGGIDEQLEVNTSPPEFMVIRCCGGSPKTSGTLGLVVTIAVVSVEVIILAVIVYFYMLRRRAIPITNQLEMNSLYQEADKVSSRNFADEKSSPPSSANNSVSVFDEVLSTSNGSSSRKMD